MQKALIIFSLSFLFSCSQGYDKYKPIKSSITESIYASGIIISEDQYVVYPKVSGIIEDIYVEVGDEVIKGSPILSIYDNNQHLNRVNAGLTAEFYDFKSNVVKLSDLQNQIDISKLKMKNDSIQFDRQTKLRERNVGTEIDFDLSKLAYKNSQSNYSSAINQYQEYKRQLKYNSEQAKNNLRISGNNQKDYTVFSEINGKVYRIDKNKGEMINPQIQLAILGSKDKYILEMQVDESDILQIVKGQNVIVSMDSYKDETFEAVITRINPIMDEKTKSFIIEATFIDPPKILYPNLNFEANIIIKTKQDAILIPRSYVTNDSIVILEKGDTTIIETGLRDFRMIEVLSGLNTTQTIRKLKE